ncbi:hypothetical protein, partial [Bifidobacterium ramosum]|uniref:hypothetical protein n=1 Tax=Bifidobacterium ramosum TaxID=1798158 RepID=UPI001952CBDA
SGLAIKTLTLKSSTNTLLSSQTTTTSAGFLQSLGEVRRAEQRDMNLHATTESRKSHHKRTDETVANTRFLRRVETGHTNPLPSV